jgi:formylglycine-generating enzyme required for sulfatase activity
VASFSANPWASTLNIVKNDKRMLRAGFWDFNPGFCRSACRNHHLPDYFSNRVGLRVVRLP